MTYLRFSPFREFGSVAKDLEKYVNETLAVNNSGNFNPIVDVFEDKDNIFVEMEVAGLSKEEIKLSLNESVLTITGEKKSPIENDEKKYFWSERSYGTFSRSFRLPKEILIDRIEAKFENGVLTIVVPKMQPVKPEEKVISIK